MGFFNNLFGKKQDNTSSDPFERAVKLEKVGKSGEAVAFYKSYIEAHKGHTEAYQNLAAMYGRLGMWEDGIKVAKLFDCRLSYLHDDWSHHFIIQAQSENSKRNKQAERHNKTEATVKPKLEQPIEQQTKIKIDNKVVVNPAPKVEQKPQLPKQANYRGEYKSPTYIEQLKAVIAELHAFDFYTSDYEPKIPADKAEKIRNIYRSQELLLLQGKEAEEQQDFIKAATIYEGLYKQKCLLPEAYNRLIVIYKMANLDDDAKYVQYRAKLFFTNLRNEQKTDVLLNAEKYGCREMVSNQIKKGKRISYYDGLYDLYDPFPFADNW